MLEYFYTWKKKIAELRQNHLAWVLEEMAARCREIEMSYVASHCQIKTASCFGDWLLKNKIPIDNIGVHDAMAFLAQFVPTDRKDTSKTYGPPAGNTRAGVMAALKIIHREYPPKEIPLSPVERELQRHLAFLREKRALAESTLITRASSIRPFLADMFPDGPIRVDRLTPEMVQRYVFAKKETLAPPSLRGTVCSALKSLFEDWALLGHSTKLLVAAIPRFRVARRCLPHTLIAEDDLDTLWKAFDRSTPLGRRDYAATRCMSDLGMRVGDVFALTLDDVRWRKGEIRVPNHKGGDPLWLPLPHEVGSALADYVMHGRPTTASRRMFVRRHASRGDPQTTSTLKNAVRRALRRAGLQDRYSGTHIFRHTVATRLRREKASMKDMGDVLGHRSLQSTTIYAQIDQPALRAVAQPWPEGDA